jgi:hypothetical protein
MQLFYNVMLGLGGLVLAGVGILFLCGGVHIALLAFERPI